MLVAAHSALALSNTTGAGAIHVSPSLCENLVECRDGVIRTGAHHACGTVPECSGRGSCQDGLSCRCDRGWFGRDCSHRERDCSQLRSCVDCQDAANQAFCGWCAAGHYCVPKHVHKALAKRGRECLAWFEDTCPAAHATNATGTGTVGPGGAGADDGLWELAALGDESSVMLAEALTSLYEEGSSGEGNGQRASSWGSVLLVLSVAAASLRCLVIEVRKGRERRRFEEFMAEEAELRRSSLGGTPAAQPVPGPQLELAGKPSSWLANPAALVEALGGGIVSPSPRRTSSIAPVGTADCSDHPSLTPSLTPLDSSVDARADVGAPGPIEGEGGGGGGGGGDGGSGGGDEEVDAAALRHAVREAARIDLEERKERRRQQAMQLKEGMEAEALAHVAQSVSRRLQQRVTELATPSTAHTAAADPGGAVAGATSMDEPPPDDVVDEEVEEAPVASSSPTGADRTKAAEEEFLRALDDF